MTIPYRVYDSGIELVNKAVCYENIIMESSDNILFKNKRFTEHVLM